MTNELPSKQTELELARERLMHRTAGQFVKKIFDETVSADSVFAAKKFRTTVSIIGQAADEQYGMEIKTEEGSSKIHLICADSMKSLNPKGISSNCDKTIHLEIEADDSDKISVNLNGGTAGDLPLETPFGSWFVGKLSEVAQAAIAHNTSIIKQP
jgi:hypothetical protein